MIKKIVMFHQGAELYGSDYIFLMSVRALAQNHKIVVVLDSDGPLVERLKAERIEAIEIIPLAIVRRSSIRTPFALLRYLGALAVAVRRLRLLLRKHRPQIVYLNTLGLISPFLASTGMRMRRIHHIHEIFVHPRLVFRALYSLSEIYSDQVICVSQAVHETVGRMSLLKGRKGRVIHNGIALMDVSSKAADDLGHEIREAFAKPDLPLAAYVARLHYWKGQEQFFDVVAQLIERGFPINVAFFGAPFVDYPDLQDALAAKAKARGLDGNVHFFGFRRDSHALFATADLSIMGSVEPDPFPTIVLESMAQGCPVVAYAHGGTTEMIRDNHSGLLVAPRDVDGMANAIVRITQDPILREHLATQARCEFDANFRLEGYVRRLNAVAESW